MIITLPIIIALFGVYLDYKVCRRIINSDINNHIKRAFVTVVAISWLLILLAPVVIHLSMKGENCVIVMKSIMVMLTTYLTLSVPRMLFNVLWLPTKSRLGLRVALAFSGLLGFIFLYSALVTRTDYKVRSVELCYDNLPAEFDGYRVAFFSDLHIGSMLAPAKELREIIAMIDKEEVDAVFFGGDITNIAHSEIT